MSSPQNETMKPNLVEFFSTKQQILLLKTLSVSPMLRPIMSEPSKTAKSILVLYWGLIFAVLDVSLIMGLNIGETDSFFTLIIVISGF